MIKFTAQITSYCNIFSSLLYRNVKKNKMLLNVHVNVQDVRNGYEDSSSRSPLLSVPSPNIISNTRIHLESPTLTGRFTETYGNENFLLKYCFFFCFFFTYCCYVIFLDKGRSPQAIRRDYGLTITHRWYISFLLIRH